MRRRRWAVVAVLLVSGAAVAVWFGRDRETLDAKVARIVPGPDEQAWRKIEWRTDLLEARKEAEQQGKPIFMWLMDGNPLGLV